AVAGESGANHGQCPPWTQASIPTTAANSASEVAGTETIGDGQVFDRERGGGVHCEHLNHVAAADGDHAPTINGGVEANVLGAGDGDRRGPAAVEGHVAVETRATGEAGVQRRLGARGDDAGERGRGRTEDR